MGRTGNEIFLLVANRRGSRGPDDRRPLGAGRETYFWSTVAAIGLFVAGAAVSVWHGIASLLAGESSNELIDRNRRFLTGEPGSRALWSAVVQRIEQLPEVASVRFVRIEFVGPKQIYVVASVDLVGDFASITHCTHAPATGA